MKSRTIDMTKGSILPELIRFTLPLIFGNVFQLTYNMVDTIVIGRFAGSNSLAAVGTCDPIMNVMILAVSGVCVGASVLMSRFFGAGETERLRDELRTTVFMGVIAALFILIAGFCACPLILKLMQVPDAIFPDAMTYLRVIFLGMPFTCLYNIYAAGLRSVGDSRTPLRYLIISTVTNMCLDLLFVAVFHMGVLGAGMATVIAEGLSAVLCIVFVTFKVPLLHFSLSALLHPDKDLAAQTIRYGGVTALQQCTQPIGNLLIQSTVNTLGVASIAAFNTVRKIEDIGLVPGRTISTSIMTFTAQNEGAGNSDRTEDGYRRGMLLELIASFLVCTIIFLLKRPLMRLFTADEEIIAQGLQYYAVMIFAYWLPCTTNGRQGYFRGIGAMRTTLFGTMSQITMRVLTTWLLVPKIGIRGIGFACMAGWMTMTIWQAPYRIYLRNKRRQAEDSGRAEKKL